MQVYFLCITDTNVGIVSHHTLSNKVMTCFFKTLRDEEKDVEWWNYLNFLEEVLEFNNYLYS